MNDDEKPQLSDEKLIRKQVRKLLKEAIESIDLEAHLFEVEDEDGSKYYTLQPKSKLTAKHIMVVDDALTACARLYSAAGIPNWSKYYRKVARMVHYALSEIDAREAMEITLKDME